MGFDPDWECYPYTARPTGEQVDLSYSHDITYESVLKIDGKEVLTLCDRTKHYSLEYHRLTELHNPYITDLSNGMGSGSASGYEPTTYTESGAAADEIDYTDATILFMDLRNDIVEFEHTRYWFTASGTGNAPLSVSADIGQTQFAPESIRLDVVGIDLSHTLYNTVKQEIRLPFSTLFPIDKSSNTYRTVRIGASDRSGFCGTIESYVCLPWGSYGTVDLSKPHSTSGLPNGLEYTHLYDENPSDYPLEYYPHWNEVGGTNLTRADAELFASLWPSNGIQSGRLDVGFPYKEEPIGSWALDADSNIFLSMKHEDGSYTKLFDALHNNIISLPGFNVIDTVPFHPIAPI